MILKSIWQEFGSFILEIKNPLAYFDELSSFSKEINIYGIFL